ncbi:hypothetical protein LWI29_033057 [Acer saccharum]|uniref:Uncharacterized protein n=1 Tax=Acer saccharum TaxID=4024 RepID=A0AA39RNK6_ACESA|nr:hypothetical protein LWI29_033057 [Acer saccharum]
MFRPEKRFSVWTHTHFSLLLSALLGQIGGEDFKLQYTQSLNNLQGLIKGDVETRMSYRWNSQQTTYV